MASTLNPQRLPRSSTLRSTATEDGALRTAHSAGFTLIEFIGVLAILAILAAVLVPVVIKQVDNAAVNAETANLSNISHALVLQVQHNYEIPDETTWGTALGNWLSLPVSSITNNARSYNRAFLYDTNGFSLTLPYTQTTGLSNGVSLSNTNNLRVMIVSSLSANLPVVSGDPADFDAIWNTTAGNIPGTWSSWGGRADDLLIQRVNLMPLFHRLILNAEDTNNFGSFVVQSGAIFSTNIYVLTTNPVDAWYLQGTVISLYDTNNINEETNLEANVVVQADASYVFENGAWHGQLSGWGTNGPASPTASPPSAADAFTSLATQFTARGYQDSTPKILAGFYTFMMDYNAWSSNNIFGTNNVYYTNILSDAVRMQYLPAW